MVYSLSYEDLRQRPDPVLRAILALCELDHAEISEDMVRSCMSQDSQKNSNLSWTNLEKTKADKPAAADATATGATADHPAAVESSTFTPDQIAAFDLAVRAFGLRQSTASDHTTLHSPIVPPVPPN